MLSAGPVGRGIENKFPFLILRFFGVAHDTGAFEFTGDAGDTRRTEVAPGALRSVRAQQRLIDCEERCTPVVIREKRLVGAARSRRRRVQGLGVERLLVQRWLVQRWLVQTGLVEILLIKVVLVEVGVLIPAINKFKN